MSDVQKQLIDQQLESFDAASLLGREMESPVNPLKTAQWLAMQSRRRCAWLALSTVLAWIVACGAAIWTVEIYFNEIRRQQPLSEYRYAKLHEEIEGIPWDELTADQRREKSTRQRVVEQANDLMMLLAQASVVLFGVAALLSVWLTIASRRVALRQINANLLAITTELRKTLPGSPQIAG